MVEKQKFFSRGEIAQLEERWGNEAPWPVLRSVDWRRLGKKKERILEIDLFI